MKLTYLSHSAFLVETASHKILIDPFLTGNPLAKTKPEEIECDFILLTHGHSDHIGDAVPIAKRTGAPIITTPEVAVYCAAQGANVHPMGIGGAHQFPFGRVKFTIAHHSSSILENNPPIYLGNPAGILITAEGKTIYDAGDTGLFLDMKLIGELDKIDVALLPIGDNYTMGIDDAVRALEFVNSPLAIPTHYNTFDAIKADPHEFAQKVKAANREARVLSAGETIQL